MNMEDLINFFRDATEDLEEPYKWSSYIIAAYLGMAQIDFVRRLGGINDQLSVELPNDVETPLPPDVINVSAGSDGNGTKLKIITGNAAECCSTYYDLRYFNGRISWGCAAKGGVVKLAINRLPKPLHLKSTDELEVHPIHRPFLVYFALSEAYKKHDAETYDRVRQDQYLMMYEQYVTKCNRERFAGTLRLT